MKYTLENFLDNILFEEDIVKEGGNAVKGVSRIKKKFIIPTINKFVDQYLKPLFNITYDENAVFAFGSTGKKPDIDIAIDMNQLPVKTVAEAVKLVYTFAKKATFNYEIIINSMTNDMIHFAYPQYDKIGNKTGETVQIDLFFSLFPEFCKFFTFTLPPNKTKYKSAHRNELLRAIATVLTKRVLTEDKNGIELIWNQEDFNDNGVYRETKTLIDEAGNRLKYKDTDEDLISSYAKVIDSIPITHDPIECIKRFVGDFSIERINSFEKLLFIIKYNTKFKYKEFKEDILYDAAIRLIN